ncbi:MAG: hypothetical protein AB7K52_13770 [Phycisphaerales bacterium]
MPRRRSNPGLIWLCLIWFTLTSSLCTGKMVICQDSLGGSRIEWGCGRSTSGECLTSCESESGDKPGDLQPCQDTPISTGEQFAKALPRPLSDLANPVPEMVAISNLWLDLSVPVRVGWVPSEPERPPDALKHIRTIVLLV